jgi:hypothetical protein
MRAVFAILLFALFGSISSARAEVLFSGSVSTLGPTGKSCSASESGSGSLNLNCSDAQTAGYGMVTGSGDPFSGSMFLHVSGGNEFLMGFATSQIDLKLNETYVLTGGVGPATVNFALDIGAPRSGDVPSTSKGDTRAVFDTAVDAGIGGRDVVYGLVVPMVFDAFVDPEEILSFGRVVDRHAGPSCNLAVVCSGQGIKMGLIREKFCRFSEDIFPKPAVSGRSRRDAAPTLIVNRSTGKKLAEPETSSAPYAHAGALIVRARRHLNSQPTLQRPMPVYEMDESLTRSAFVVTDSFNLPQTDLNECIALKSPFQETVGYS